LDGVMTLHQTFVLRRRVEQDGGGVVDDSGLNSSASGISGQSSSSWPLVVVSHQMVVREEPLLASEQLDIHFPWIRSVLES